MKKKILLCLSFTLASFNSYSSDGIFGTCENFEISQLLTEMKQSKEFIAQNPFHTNCLPFILGAVEKPQLTIDDFKGQKMLYDFYLKSANDPEMHVIPLYDAKNGNYYHFMRFNEDDAAFKLMKQQWSHNNDKMALYFDDFMKLHELSHLAPELDQDLKLTEKETLADISAVYLLSFGKSFTVTETIEFLKSVREIRKRDFRKGYISTNGKMVKDKKHLNDTLFFKAIKDLKSIKNQDQIFKMTELMINIKENQVPSTVRDRYKPK